MHFNDKVIRPELACEQAILFGQAKRASRERASEGPFLCPSRLRCSLARSRETRLTRPNMRACSQVRPERKKKIVHSMNLS